MASTYSTFRRCKLLIATAFTLGMLTTVSQAYTIEQQEMCAGDAMRLCSADIPNVDRITACMERQRELLSDGCKSVFEVEPEATTPPASYSSSTRPSKPINLVPNPRRG